MQFNADSSVLRTRVLIMFLFVLGMCDMGNGHASHGRNAYLNVIETYVLIPVKIHIKKSLKFLPLQSLLLIVLLLLLPFQVLLLSLFLLLFCEWCCYCCYCSRFCYCCCFCYRCCYYHRCVGPGSGYTTMTPGMPANIGMALQALLCRDSSHAPVLLLTGHRIRDLATPC